MHVVDRVGCACNLFWNCGKKGCLASGKILSRVSTVETSGKFKRKHPELPSALGDYDINRQVVLACQQSGGGARMAATFCCVLSLSLRSTWKTTFTQVEELIAKFQIRLGKKLLNDNLQEEIRLSPMNEKLHRNMLALMMNRGWDQMCFQKGIQ